MAKERTSAKARRNKITDYRLGFLTLMLYLYLLRARAPCKSIISNLVYVDCKLPESPEM
jgi:hypothetical protein